MTDTQDTEKRMAELEIRLSLCDDMLDQLNQTIFRQQQQIDLLVRELFELRRRIPEAVGSEFRSLHDELPPHY